MLRYFKGFYMALGMFSAIPLPRRSWDDNCKSLLLPCFPLVGAVIGGLWWGLAELIAWGRLDHLVVMAAVLALIPFFLSGFLHLEGYMDTCDAILSRRPLEEKLRILKDPHTGAFAVITLAVLFLLQFSAMCDICFDRWDYAPFAAIPVLSRCCSALAFMCLKPLPQSEYAKIYLENAKSAHRVFVIIIAVAAIMFLFWCTGFSGLVLAAAVMLGYAAAMWAAYRELGGVSGDLAGFALVISELCGLMVFTVAG